MGQIIIEIPQDITRTYRISSKDSAKKLLINLENLAKKEVAIEDEDILGVWTVKQKSIKKLLVD